jgi:hypothetical protein
LATIPFGLRELAFGLGLLMLMQVAPGDRLLIVIDQGHVARARVPDVLRTVGDLLTAVEGTAATVAIVSGERVVYPDAETGAIAASLSGEAGFADELQRQYSMAESEASDIRRGNESTRDAVAQRLCASGKACDTDVRALARTVIEAARNRNAATLKSLKTIVEEHRPATIGVVTEQKEALERSFRPAIVLRPGEKGPRIAGGARPQPPPPSRSMDASVQPLVDRATAHVQRFVTEASFLLADERYVQEVKSRAGSFNLPPTSNAGIVVEKRELESEVAIVQLRDEQVWLLARDVIRVNGKPIPDSDRQPLPAAAATSMTDAIARFREIAERGARFNIGPIRRNLNVPTLALWFLTPGVRDRFDFDQDGETSVDGMRCVVLRYREHGKGMLQGDGQPVPAVGRFLIARDSGAVVRTELVLANFSSNWSGRSPMPGARVSIAVSYRFDPSVSSWVPATMEERYDYPGRRDLDWVVGAATYTNYRRFQVGTRIVR